MRRTDHPRETLINVPHDLRPHIGTRMIAFDAVCAKGVEALGDVVKRNIPVLDVLALELMDAASSCQVGFAKADVERLMKCANDLRGMASTMGSEITSEIASAIYLLCEHGTPLDVSKPLILLLAGAARQLVGYRHEADDGTLKRRVEGLLADVRAQVGAA